MIKTRMKLCILLYKWYTNNPLKLKSAKYLAAGPPGPALSGPEAGAGTSPGQASASYSPPAASYSLFRPSKREISSSRQNTTFRLKLERGKGIFL